MADTTRLPEWMLPDPAGTEAAVHVGVLHRAGDTWPWPARRPSHEGGACCHERGTFMTSDTAVGVCGFGRCGSTMMMAMLAAGGIPPVEGSAPGSHELPDLFPETLVAAVRPGRAVKLLDFVLHDQLPDADWKFIWIDRDSRQQARSQVKFMKVIAGLRLDRDDERVLARSYVHDRPRAIAMLQAIGPVFIVGYEDVLRRPEWEAAHLGRFLGGDFDADAAALMVHQRDGRCRPDLAFELGAVG